jgi:glycosyltransferase involved in cell wall biosynthesis
MIPRMRVLIVSPRQCWPLTNGARLREYHLARYLGRHAEITSVFFASPHSPPLDRENLPFCRSLIAVPPPRKNTPWKLLRGLGSRHPLPVLNYWSVAMEATLSRLIKNQPFDLVQLESIHMAAYAPLFARAGKSIPVVYNWHNIESELWNRYAATVPSFARSVYASVTARRIAAIETRVLASAFGHLVCSERERDKLLAFEPGARIAVIPNGVDTEFFQRTTQPSGDRFRLLFVGLMSYYANVDAAVRFTHLCWPVIRERFPQWKFTIAGANPDPAVVALQSEPAVEVTGTVPDLRAYYNQAFAAIVPLRFGGGTRLKVLEAMAAGVPVLSTTLGVEGLDVLPGKHFLVVDDDSLWLPTLEGLWQDDLQRQSLVDAALQLVRTRYAWDVVGASLFSTYVEWLAHKS